MLLRRSSHAFAFLAGISAAATAVEPLLSQPPAEWSVNTKPLLIIPNDIAGGDVLDRVRSITRRADGVIVVANGGSKRILLFNANGSLLKAVGRDGSGPGEFRQLASLRLAKNGAIHAYDGIARAVHVFSGDGSFQRAVSLTSVSERMPSGLRPLYLPVRDDVFLAFSTERFTSRPGSVFRPISVVYQVDANGPVSLGRYPSLEQFQGRTTGGTALVPLGRDLMVVASEQHTFIGDTGSDSIQVFNARGERLPAVRVPTSARALSGTQRDRLRDSVVKIAEASSRATAEDMQLAREVPIPLVRPAFRELAVDVDGLLWIQEHSWPSRSNRWTVVSSAGRVVSKINLPLGLRVKEIGRDYVLGVMFDEDGLESIHLVRLERR